MKQCGLCGDTKPLEEFHFRNKAKGIRQPWCKECKAVYSKTKYATDEPTRQMYRDHRKRRREENSQFMRALKEGKPCTDCKVAHPWYVMQWDHISNDKLHNVSEMALHAKETIMTEIDKCELVCANCHAHRTYTRR